MGLGGSLDAADKLVISDIARSWAVSINIRSRRRLVSERLFTGCSWGEEFGLGVCTYSSSSLRVEARLQNCNIWCLLIWKLQAL